LQNKHKVIAVKAQVWSRVVGFYRPVEDFNPGKQEEYKDRYQHEPEYVTKHFGPAEPVVRHG